MSPDDPEQPGAGSAAADAEFRFSPRPNRAHEIEWRPWGEPAFAEARKLGRPVLLSLSAVWCHWCHVMDETAYSDPRVIETINEQCVPVRVDNDRHPDVNRRYNMGGWPTTAFLTGSGEVITGATYLPADQMLEALHRVLDFYAANRSALQAADAGETAQAGDGRAALAHGGVTRRSLGDAAFSGDAEVPGDIPAEIMLQVMRAFDPMYGGLGADAKFPQADVLAFVLAYDALRGAGSPGSIAPGTSALLRPARLHEVLRTTLDKMAGGGLYDHLGNGFFRYSTRRDWSVPHYEKMLEDNSRLAALYLDAFALHGDDAYREAAAGTVEYLMDTLGRDDPPAFAGSQDADEEYYCVGTGQRADLPAPSLDRTVYVDWNALAARALARASVLLERPELGERAGAVIDLLLHRAARVDGLAHYLTAAGEPCPDPPLLVDQATVAAALLDLYEITGDRERLEAAQALAGFAGARLRGPDGRYLDRLALPGASPGLLAQPVPALDDNALVAEILLRLEAYTGEAHYRDHALDVLLAWADSYQQHGVAAAPYGLALLRYLERPLHIAVVGPRDDAATQALLKAALAAPVALRTVQLLDPAIPFDAAHLANAGFAEAAAPAAYVCRGQTCLAPAADPAALAARLAGA